MLTARGQRAGLREWLGLFALTCLPLLADQVLDVAGSAFTDGMRAASALLALLLAGTAIAVTVLLRDSRVDFRST
jgi:hypothetical protein